MSKIVTSPQRGLEGQETMSDHVEGKAPPADTTGERDGEGPARRSGKTFVLVHGAWRGGWCWRTVASQLRADGHDVFAPTLTGLGERSHLLTREVDVSAHARDVLNLLAWEDLSDIVLVGHSYGGIVISAVADGAADRIASIVFLDAFLPNDGDDLVSRTKFPDAIKAAASRGDISVPAPPASAFGVSDPELAAWVDRKSTPQPFGTYLEKVKLSGGRERVARRSYVRARGHVSPAFDLDFERAAARPGWRTAEWDCGHDVMVIDPRRTTSLLLELA